MGRVLAKPGLMLWPLNMATKYIRENAYWNEVAGAFEVTELILGDAQKAHIKRRDAGADTGTQVHALVEKRLSQNVPFQPSEIALLTSEVALALGAFEVWMEKAKPNTIAVEQIVFSEEYGYAGMYDSLLEIDDKVYLCDLKTTNSSRTAPDGIYPENFIQLGAYYLAYEEQRQYELSNDGYTVLKPIDDLMIISCKKDGRLNVGTASQYGFNILDCMTMWLSTLNLFESLGKLTSKLGGM